MDDADITWHEIDVLGGGPARIWFVRQHAPTVTVNIEHAPPGVTWTDILPDGTTVHRRPRRFDRARRLAARVLARLRG